MNYPPLVRPKTLGLQVPSVLKAKLRNTDHVNICPKGKARTYGPCALSVPKVKLVHLDRVHYILEFCILSEGGEEE